jgi:hypothetical protein
MKTLNEQAKIYAQNILKTGDLLQDIAAAFLDGYTQAQADIVRNWPVPVGNRWWYYDAELIKGGSNATDEKRSKN